MARTFRFVDILGCELHTINDPQDKLPIPEIRQVISIGRSSMRVESVRLGPSASNTPCTYLIRVRLIPGPTEADA